MSKLWLAAMLAAVMTTPLPAARQAPATDAHSLPRGGDFRLTDQQGRPFDSSSLRGRAMVLFFGYTECAEACPRALARLRQVSGRLGAEFERVTPVFVSIDYERDNPQVIASYLREFPLRVIGLSGTKSQLESVAERFNAPFRVVRTNDEVSVSHATSFFLIDPGGRVRQVFHHTDSIETIADGIRRVLQP